MKRPLCLLAILVTAIVYLCLELFLYDTMTEKPVLPSGSHAELVGYVQGKELKKSYTGEYLPVIYIIPMDGKSNSSMKVQCYLESDSYVPSIGEYVRVTGKVRGFDVPTNPGEFDSRLYYLSLKIAYSIRGGKVTLSGGKKNAYRESLYRVKNHLSRALDSSLDEQDAGIMKAMLLGDKSGLDRTIKDDFQSNGVIHIIAISGTHIAFLGMGLYKLLKKLKCHNIICGLLPIMVMYSYGVMCGMGSSSFRAICMFSVKMLAPILGRTYDVLSSLALAEILLILDQPLYLYNSGFLFSFGAVLGITLVKPAMELHFNKDDRRMEFSDDTGEKTYRVRLQLFCRKALSKGLEGIKTSVAITLVTLPVYAVYYHTFPLHSIFLNLLIIPLLGILLMAGVVCLVLAPLGISPVPALGVSAVLFLYRKCCSFGVLVRGFTWYMGHSDRWQVAVYYVLLAAFVAASRKEGEPLNRTLGIRSAKVADLIRMGLVAMAVIILTFHPRPGFEIDMIDVGQGDGIVLSCGHKSILIDGGSTSEKEVGRYRIIPFLKYKGIGTLEAVVMTHEDEDHISGILEILENMERGGIRVKKLILPEIDQGSRGENYFLLEEKALSLGIPVLYINSGESMNLGKVEVYCLNPALGMKTDSANEYSTALLVKYGGFTALLTGDVEGAGQVYLKSQLQKEGIHDIALLKVAHHGSGYTTDAEFLEMIRPKAALISCGRDNAYGHPHRDLLERLEEAGAQIYRTDQSGALKVSAFGDKIRISTYKDY